MKNPEFERLKDAFYNLPIEDQQEFLQIVVDDGSIDIQSLLNNQSNFSNKLPDYIDINELEKFLNAQ